MVSSSKKGLGGPFQQDINVGDFLMKMEILGKW